MGNMKRKGPINSNSVFKILLENLNSWKNTEKPSNFIRKKTEKPSNF